MSAYIIDPETMDRIISYLYLRNAGQRLYPRHTLWHGLAELQPRDHAEAQEIGQAVYVMNREAVRHHYPQDDDSQLPGPSEWTIDQWVWHPTLPVSARQAYDEIGCLLYQCSEGDVPETRLYQRLELMRITLAMELVRAA